LIQALARPHIRQKERPKSNPAFFDLHVQTLGCTLPESQQRRHDAKPLAWPGISGRTVGNTLWEMRTAGDNPMKRQRRFIPAIVVVLVFCVHAAFSDSWT